MIFSKDSLKAKDQYSALVRELQIEFPGWEPGMAISDFTEQLLIEHGNSVVEGLSENFYQKAVQDELKAEESHKAEIEKIKAESDAAIAAAKAEVEKAKAELNEEAKKMAVTMLASQGHVAPVKAEKPQNSELFGVQRVAQFFKSNK
jgi:vacuolar-type H+-ATPase subunit H